MITAHDDNCIMCGARDERGRAEANRENRAQSRCTYSRQNVLPKIRIFGARPEWKKSNRNNNITYCVRMTSDSTATFHWKKITSFLSEYVIDQRPML